MSFFLLLCNTDHISQPQASRGHIPSPGLEGLHIEESSGLSQPSLLRKREASPFLLHEGVSGTQDIALTKEILDLIFSFLYILSNFPIDQEWLVK